MEEGSHHQVSSSVLPEVPHVSRAPGSPLCILSPPFSLRAHPLFLLVHSLLVAVAEVHTYTFHCTNLQNPGEPGGAPSVFGDAANKGQQSSDLMDEPETW